MFNSWEVRLKALITCMPIIWIPISWNTQTSEPIYLYSSLTKPKLRNATYQFTLKKYWHNKSDMETVGGLCVYTIFSLLSINWKCVSWSNEPQATQKHNLITRCQFTACTAHAWQWPCSIKVCLDPITEIFRCKQYTRTKCSYKIIAYSFGGVQKNCIMKLLTFCQCVSRFAFPRNFRCFKWFSRIIKRNTKCDY